MTNRVNRRVDNQSNVIHGIAIDTERAEDHLNRELAQLDWHPTDTTNNNKSGKGGHASPAEQAAVHLLEGNEHRAQINQWINDLETLTRKGRTILDNALSWRTPHTALFATEDYGTRCRHADCTQWASPHHIHNLTDGTRLQINDWCDQHWVTTACRLHGDHPHENRRVDGLLVCEAAYRKHLRSTIRTVA